MKKNKDKPLTEEGRKLTEKGINRLTKRNSHILYYLECFKLKMAQYELDFKNSQITYEIKCQALNQEKSIFEKELQENNLIMEGLKKDLNKGVTYTG